MSSSIRIKIEDVALCKIMRIVKGAARNKLVENALAAYLLTEKGQLSLDLFCPELVGTNVSENTAPATVVSFPQKNEDHSGQVDSNEKASAIMGDFDY